MRQVQALKKYYGNNIQIGGSGVDLTLRLPETIEAMPADYDLYPELKDRAIGFLTRGCPHKCPFCVVPIKEGPPCKVSDLASLLRGKREKLILLDDNLLAHAESEQMLEKMACMQHQPIGTDAPSPDAVPFFDDQADRLIDELIGIEFTQNMKSMEKYYRWVSKKYAMAFGKLHNRLVDTIFRYNHRYKRGEYIATLAGTRKR